MTTDTDIALRLRKALAEYLKRDVTTIKPGDVLRDDLGLDSLTTIELLYQIEEEFDVEIPDTDLPSLVTVADVTAYLQRRTTLTQHVPARPESPSDDVARSESGVKSFA